MSLSLIPPAKELLSSSSSCAGNNGEDDKSNNDQSSYHSDGNDHPSHLVILASCRHFHLVGGLLESFALQEEKDTSRRCCVTWLSHAFKCLTALKRTSVCYSLQSDTGSDWTAISFSKDGDGMTPAKMMCPMSKISVSICNKSWTELQRLHELQNSMWSK